MRHIQNEPGNPNESIHSPVAHQRNPTLFPEILYQITEKSYLKKSATKHVKSISRKKTSQNIFDKSGKTEQNFVKSSQLNQKESDF